MEIIQLLPPMERPREKLRYRGADALTDGELLAVLLGSGNKGLPVSAICENVLKAGDLGRLSVEELCRVDGIGEAKALQLLAAVALGQRLTRPELIGLKTDTSNYYLLQPIYKKMTELQYLLVLMTAGRELLAIVDGRALLPEMGWVTEIALEAGAKRVMVARNGWMLFSNAERKYINELTNAAGMLGLIVQGMLAVGNGRFKTI